MTDYDRAELGSKIHIPGFDVMSPRMCISLDLRRIHNGLRSLRKAMRSETTGRVLRRSTTSISICDYSNR